MFIESPRFPMVLSFGATGGPQYRTDVIMSANGQEQRNQCWREPLCRWDVGSQHRTQDAVEQLIHFFHAVAQGTLHSFRFRDVTDWRFDNPIGSGDGTQTIFQLIKTYTYGARSAVRVLRKPTPDTVRIFVDELRYESFMVDWTTGVVTLAEAPPLGQIVRAVGQFDVPARFEEDLLPMTRVDPEIWSLARIGLCEVRLETLE